MSFSFGFSAEDLNGDGFVHQKTGTSIDLGSNNNANLQSINPLDSPALLESDVIQPVLENFESVLKSLKDVRISFEEIMVPQLNSPNNTQIPLYRRELFDIKHQLMSEDGETNIANTELDILMNEDLRKNVYEGGLKSWECSIDLVSLLSEKFQLTKELNFEQYNCMIELGCGTALPTEYILNEYLKQDLNSGLTLILADYNSSALRLASLPNLIITWIKGTLSVEQLTKYQPENITMDHNEEIMFTEDLLNAFYDDVRQRNISIVLISGSWGRKFSNIVHDNLRSIQDLTNKSLLILTSETIYQPDHLPTITETLIDLHNNAPFERVNSIVAAKDIYFGVGGSLIEFEKYLTNKSIQFTTTKINAGLKRSIVLI